MRLRKKISSDIIKRSMHNYLDLVFVLGITIERRNGRRLGTLERGRKVRNGL